MAFVAHPGGMASVFDILGLTRIVVSSVAQSIGALKLQFESYRSLPEVLDAAGEKASRIGESIVLLKGLTEVSTLDSEFFSHKFSNVQKVQLEFVSIQAEIANNSSVAR